MLLASLAALVLVVTAARHLPLKFPGHSGVLWMSLLVAARGVVRKPGSAALVGLVGGLVGALVGVGDKGWMDTFFVYASAGIGVDAVLAIAPYALSSCAAAGVAGNVVKLGVKALLESWIGVPTGFVVLGWSYPVLAHALFGAAGGLLGYAFVELLRRVRFDAWVVPRP